MARLVTCIVEVATPHNHEKEQQFCRVMRLLSQSTFGGHEVLGVVNGSICEPTHISDYGQNYKCQCANPEPWGVDRYFGTYLVLSGEVTSAVFGAYHLGAIARVELCGIVHPLTEHVERKRVTEASVV